MTPLLRLGALRKYPCLDHACRSGSYGRGQALDVFLQELVPAQNKLRILVAQRRDKIRG